MEGFLSGHDFPSVCSEATKVADCRCAVPASGRRWCTGNDMGDLWIPDLHSHRRQPRSDVADPVVTARDGEGLGDRFVERLRVTSSWCAVLFRSWTTTVQALGATTAFIIFAIYSPMTRSKPFDGYRRETGVGGVWRRNLGRVRGCTSARLLRADGLRFSSPREFVSGCSLRNCYSNASHTCICTASLTCINTALYTCINTAPITCDHPNKGRVHGDAQ
jgi:hypothetical protein